MFTLCSLNPLVFLGYVTSTPESRDHRVLTEKGRTKVRGLGYFGRVLFGSTVSGSLVFFMFHRKKPVFGWFVRSTFPAGLKRLTTVATVEKSIS